MRTWGILKRYDVYNVYLVHTQNHNQPPNHPYTGGDYDGLVTGDGFHSSAFTLSMQLSR